MKNKLSNTREIIRHIGIKSVIASVLVFLLTVSATCVGGYQLYRYTKESLLLQGEVNATRSGKEFDRYLIIRKNTVILAGHVVDGMIREKRPVSDVLEYLTMESRSLKESIDKDSTGMYGWIMEQYCDGEGWVPDEDYVPTERPWYIETMADQSSDVTYVKPYLDAQTNTVMTTMATKLCDGKSVLAFDVSLGRIQEITEEIASQTPGSYGIVVDKTGQVIAHSDSAELGHNLREEKDTLGAAVVKEVLDNGKRQFELDFQGQKYLVYAEGIEGGWKSISLVNTSLFYRPLKIILALLLLFTLLEAVIFMAIFYNLSSKNLAISIQNVQIAAVADMYLSIYDINIPADTIREIRRGKNYDMAHVLGENQKSAQSALNVMFDKNVHEMSKPVMDAFIDISTLAERLANTETITEEFLDDKKSWCRGRFIVADRDKDGHAVRALWMIESIDEEKKHRETLKHLSETDRMTGLYNRAAGEGKITELLKQGGGGMLVMVDVDKFKSVNDNFGHDVGDKVIIAVADAIGKAFRISDVVMRLGGDEFVAYAPGVQSEGVGSLCINRMFKNISDIWVPELGDHPIHVSAGAAFCPKDEIMSFSELYKEADLCAYQSKKKKGNTFTFYQKGESDEA